MTSDTKLYNLDNEKDLQEVQKLLLEDIATVGDIFDMPDNEENETNVQMDDIITRTDSIVENEEYDTDASDEIEEREGNSNTEQSDTDSSASDGNEQDCYVCVRKTGKKVVDSFSWKTPFSDRRKTSKQNLNTRLPDVKGNAKNINNVLETWRCFFDDYMLNIIVSYTNQYIDTIKDNYSRGRDVLHTDVTEIKAFIGLLYLAGQYKAGRLNLEDLWDTDGFGIEIFRMTMSLKRFRFIFQAIRFDNRETRLERRKTDRLAPIRDLFERFVLNCESCYSVSENVTLDEKLEAFRGRCAFIQYIPSKPAKYGIKIFALVDSKMFYTCKLEIYAGKQPEGPYEISNKSLDVVEQMVASIHNSGRNVTADNWFSDISLLKTLSENHRLSFVGTLKKNKWQIPHEMKNLKNREVFSSIFAYRREGTLVSYVPQNKSNKKNVLLISSMHLDGTIDQSTGDKRKPDIVTYYNSTKCGVDIVDKMCSAYNVARNTKRWPLVVFFSMLNIAGINSQVIFLGNGNEVPPRRLFLRRLGRDLLQEHLLKRSTIRCLPQWLSLRLNDILGKSDQRNLRDSSNCGSTSTKSTSRKHCNSCQKEKKTRLTKYSCAKCGQYLCLQHCGFICPDECERSGNRGEEGEDEEEV